MIRIGSILVERGVKKVGCLNAFDLTDGSQIKYPIIVINGEKPGPKLYIGAAFHGDEANGTESIRRIVNEISPDKLSGTIIAVPIQNPLAFRAGHRLPISQLFRSPLDSVPMDMHSIFPGNIEGGIFEMLVYRLYHDVISKADYAIDLHQPTTGGKYVPISFTPLTGEIDIVERSEALIRSFGTEYVVKTTKGSYARGGNMHVYLAENGIPAIMVELGEGGKLEETYVKMGVDGIKNVLKHLNMIEGVPVTFEQTVITEMVDVRARRGGLLSPQIELGELVEEGDLVARIFDPVGPPLESIHSPVRGIFIRKTTFPTIMPGERVAVFGLEAE